MQLLSVHIKNYKCIRDSQMFRIDPKVTCLVGKNESGKTAVFPATEKLNPPDAKDGTFDDLDYPRSLLLDFRDRKTKTPAHAITTHWQLSPTDISSIEEIFGKGVLENLLKSKSRRDTINPRIGRSVWMKPRAFRM